MVDNEGSSYQNQRSFFSWIIHYFNNCRRLVCVSIHLQLIQDCYHHCIVIVNVTSLINYDPVAKVARLKLSA